MPQTDAAELVKLHSITRDHIGRKLRVVGRMLPYDGSRSLVLIEGGGRAILVDVTLCLDPWSTWVREKKDLIMIIGYLEANAEAAAKVPAHCSTPRMDLSIILQAILVKQTPNLDMETWNTAVDEREKASPSSKPMGLWQ